LVEVACVDIEEVLDLADGPSEPVAVGDNPADVFNA